MIKEMMRFRYAINVIRIIRSNLLALRSKELIAWTHLGLGDQISSSRIFETLNDAGIRVWLPVKERNLDFLNKATEELENISIFTVSDNASSEFAEVFDFSQRKKIPILEIGHRIYPFLRWLFPHSGLNHQLAQGSMIKIETLISERLRATLFKFPQLPVPERPYIYIDNHPGTWRAIPDEVLAEKISQGFLIVENDRNKPLYSSLELMDKAEELHLVVSAPLCLALTVDSKAACRHAYARPSLMDVDYEFWQETTHPNQLESPLIEQNFRKYSLTRIICRFLFTSLQRRKVGH